MRREFFLRLDRLARNLTPFGLTLVLIILGMLPVRIPDYASVAPILAAISLYHWAVYRPHLLPFVAVFLLGVAQDMLSGAPVGLFALVFLTFYGAVVLQRRFLAGKSFPVYWLGFAIVWFLATLELWVLASAFHVTLLDMKAFLFQYLVTAGLFPFVAWIFLRWQQAFLQQS